MKYVIWNKETDQYWYQSGTIWTDFMSATRYTEEELEHSNVPVYGIIHVVPVLT